MKKILLSSLSILSLMACQAPSDTSTSSTPQSTETVEAIKVKVSLSPTVESIQQTALGGTHGYDIIESVTTEIGARVGGSPEEAKAREWAVRKFTELGLSNVHIEEFEVPGWVRGDEEAEVIAPFPQKLHITALGGSSATPEAGVEADVAYFPTYEELEAAPVDGLEGKIVFISGRMEKAHDGAGYGPANKKRQLGATEASKRGALAVVIRSVGTDSHRFPHTGQMRYLEDVKPVPIGALSAPDADQLERILKRGDNLRLKLKLTPRSVGSVVSGNVIGDIVGSEKPEEIILIGGHLDSWDLGTGAVDDGAGVGITYGAVQVLKDLNLKPKRTIRLVAFGSEEIGLLGAFAYAEKHKDNLKNHVLASESDFGAGKVYALRTTVQGEARGALEDIQKSLAHLGVKMEAGDTSGGPDIIPMRRAGVPAIRLQQDGYDYFDLHHTPDDTLDKVNKEDVAQNVAAWATMIWMASEADVDYRETPEEVVGE